jgi:hypothetical protein
MRSHRRIVEEAASLGAGLPPWFRWALLAFLAACLLIRWLTE